MQTLGRFKIKDVLPFVTTEKIRRSYITNSGKSYKVWMDSLRYHLFSRSVACCCCGLEGTYFLLQNNEHGIKVDDITIGHFNLHGTDPVFGEVMITKDHVIPKYLGGSDTLDNYRTMCMICNTLNSKDCVPFDVILEARKEIVNRDWTNAWKVINAWKAQKEAK